MLLGIWRNIAELEESLNIKELELIVTSAREQEMRRHRFMAALKGIDLDNDESAVDRVEEMKRRIEAEEKGVSVEALDYMDMGFDVEEE